jgi:hypothetical protein
MTHRVTPWGGITDATKDHLQDVVDEACASGLMVDVAGSVLASQPSRGGWHAPRRRIATGLYYCLVS